MPFHGAYCILWRDLVVTCRSIVPEVATTVASPLTFFLAFGLGLKGYILDIDGIPYIQFVVPGLVSMAVMNESFDHGAWSMWFHRKIQWTIDEYRVSPITTEDVVIGKVCSGFVTGVLKGSIVGVIMFLLTGEQIELGNILPYGLFLVLGSIVFSCAGTIVGTLFDQPAHLGRVQAIVVQPLIFMAGVFFPIRSFPDWIEPYLRLLPTAAIFDGARDAFLHGTVDLQYLATLLVSTVFAFWLAVTIFNRYIEP